MAGWPVTRIEARLKTLLLELAAVVRARGSHLMDLSGIGPAGAARILADVGEVARFGGGLEAIRCLKRRLSDAGYRQLVADAEAGHRLQQNEAVAREGTVGRHTHPARPT